MQLFALVCAVWLEFICIPSIRDVMSCLINWVELCNCLLNLVCACNVFGDINIMHVL